MGFERSRLLEHFATIFSDDGLREHDDSFISQMVVTRQSDQAELGCE